MTFLFLQVLTYALPSAAFSAYRKQYEKTQFEKNNNMAFALLSHLDEDHTLHDPHYIGAEKWTDAIEITTDGMDYIVSEYERDIYIKVYNVPEGWETEYRQEYEALRLLLECMEYAETIDRIEAERKRKNYAMKKYKERKERERAQKEKEG